MFSRKVRESAGSGCAASSTKERGKSEWRWYDERSRGKSVRPMTEGADVRMQGQYRAGDDIHGQAGLVMFRQP